MAKGRDAAMYDLIWRFFQSSGFQPHGFCLMWQPDVFWTHVVSDLVIALSYFSIPLAMVHFVRQRRDLQYGWLLNLFSLFIVSCGVTHMFGVWTMWVPSYGAEALAKAVTAIVSLMTATLIWPLLPKLLAIPSPAMLEAANRELGFEIAERKLAEDMLRKLNEELEDRVTERTRTLTERNEELRLAREEAERSTAAKAEFLATMSHEIRTPMNGVLGMLELVRRSELTGDQRLKIETASRSANALMTLLNDILDFSRIDAGTLEIDSVPMDATEIVTDVGRLLGPVARDKGLDFTVDAPASAGAQDVGDPLRTRQIIVNLVSNAVKFTIDGGIHLRMRRQPVEGGGAMLRFEVRDTGVGIPEAAQAKLFTRFSQADGSVTRRFGGSGLGLAICRQLVDTMGGAIGFQSEEGVGSTFWFEIPVSAASASGAIAGSATASDGVRLDGRHVLVVDDNEINRLVAEAMLSTTGADLTLAVDGRDAVDKATETPFDAVLMDISMPVMDGVEAAKAIWASRGPNASTPIIAVTALAMEGDGQRFLGEGFDGYLAKPFTPEGLARAVLAAIDARSAKARENHAG
jgi:signal transduction histidine kinase/ActR/RegA family two-component response regulator